MSGGAGEPLPPRGAGAAGDGRAEQLRVAFAHLHAADPVLAALIDARPDYDPDAWLTTLPVHDLFGALVFQVMGQQISVVAARAIFDRLVARLGGTLDPAGVATLDEDTLRGIGVSRRKARTLLDLAARFADGRLAEHLRPLPDDEIVAELTQVPGIGPWTVHGALLIALRRADVLPTGDLVLRQAVRRLYGLDHLPTEAEVTAVGEAWRPYRSLGASLLFAATEGG